ncbi:MAG: formylglycine-generating enzyme family protein [Desulfovibrio sp.]|nr:formylglycine-generating enzyme family protein [Desulfovibrio sp.]
MQIAIFIGMVLFPAVFVVTGFARAAEKTYTNSIGMEFVLIPAGSFMMGTDKTPDSDDDVDVGETPRHHVTVSKPFYLGKYVVTQEQWTAVMGNNPSEFKSRNNPVEQVSWLDAQVFIKRLNAAEGHNRYRLPTEAEWEYAARAGTTSKYPFGDDPDSLGLYTWYDGNSGKHAQPVGMLQPNAWGLYDMYGNVEEWVQDWYSENYYSNSPPSDPRGPSSGIGRVVRGGGWCFPALYNTATYRNANRPSARFGFTGFRVALSPE